MKAVQRVVAKTKISSLRRYFTFMSKRLKTVGRPMLTGLSIHVLDLSKITFVHNM